ncbi:MULTISPECIES: hypothetical protein [Idiomarina]|mgnify:FL=1|jgi:hypothetical protein|uniref:hypothetical protein n=1 Tax=Idiomarina TaxID=135575 RepID=UPI000C553540|nr:MULTISPECIES: hypothetical protein [Idiomarina]MAB21754.1 hypothetical protein [Idiomarina sp.]MAO69107.1 hypothetical protein [Idiomarina sp.]MBF80865.1 hypothetical protein [Idiomarina sp.]|tara:strand:- start:1227 stop:1844 length:618 start_codon:yes stop_codon:yes gene_type:complete
MQWLVFTVFLVLLFYLSSGVSEAVNSEWFPLVCLIGVAAAILIAYGSIRQRLIKFWPFSVGNEFSAFLGLLLAAGLISGNANYNTLTSLASLMVSSMLISTFLALTKANIYRRNQFYISKLNDWKVVFWSDDEKSEDSTRIPEKTGLTFTELKRIAGEERNFVASSIMRGGKSCNITIIVDENLNLTRILKGGKVSEFTSIGKLM